MHAAPQRRRPSAAADPPPFTPPRTAGSTARHRVSQVARLNHEFAVAASRGTMHDEFPLVCAVADYRSRLAIQVRARAEAVKGYGAARRSGDREFELVGIHVLLFIIDAYSPGIGRLVERDQRVDNAAVDEQQSRAPIGRHHAAEVLAAAPAGSATHAFDSISNDSHVPWRGHSVQSPATLSMCPAYRPVLSTTHSLAPE